MNFPFNMTANSSATVHPPSLASIQARNPGTNSLEESFRLAMMNHMQGNYGGRPVQPRFIEGVSKPILDKHLHPTLKLEKACSGKMVGTCNFLSLVRLEIFTGVHSSEF